MIATAVLTVAFPSSETNLQPRVFAKVMQLARLFQTACSWCSSLSEGIYRNIFRSNRRECFYQYLMESAEDAKTCFHGFNLVYCQAMRQIQRIPTNRWTKFCVGHWTWSFVQLPFHPFIAIPLHPKLSQETLESFTLLREKPKRSSLHSIRHRSRKSNSNIASAKRHTRKHS